MSFPRNLNDIYIQEKGINQAQDMDSTQVFGLSRCSRASHVCMIMCIQYTVHIYIYIFFFVATLIRKTTITVTSVYFSFQSIFKQTHVGIDSLPIKFHGQDSNMVMQPNNILSQCFALCKKRPSSCKFAYNPIYAPSRYRYIQHKFHSA